MRSCPDLPDLPDLSDKDLWEIVTPGHPAFADIGEVIEARARIAEHRCWLTWQPSAQTPYLLVVPTDPLHLKQLTLIDRMGRAVGVFRTMVPVY